MTDSKCTQSKNQLAPFREKGHFTSIDTRPETQIWRSSDVEPYRGFEYYRDGVCQSFMDLIPEPEPNDEWQFSGQIQTIEVGGGRLNRVAASAHLVRRTRAEISNSPEECYYLNYKTRGECRINQSGHEVVLQPGDVGLFDSTVPFELEHRNHPDLAVSSFMLPHSLLREQMGSNLPDKPIMMSHFPRLGTLIRETAATLAREADYLEPKESARMYDMLVDLVAMALTSDKTVKTYAHESRGSAMLLYVKNFVDQHHRETGLNATSVAGACGISIRYLHKLFKDTETTFGEYLLAKRLHSAATALQTPELARLSIAAISLQHGFTDPAHFYRSFKSHYGCTAGEWRDTKSL